MRDRGAVTRLRRAQHASEHGNAAVELALLLPGLMVIVFGAIDFSRLFYAHIAIASAAHEAAVYLAQDIAASDSALQSVAAAEANRTGATFLSFTGSGANTTLSRATVASGTTNTTLFVRIQLAYSFRPVVPFPLAGPIPVRVVADAPKTRVLS